MSLWLPPGAAVGTVTGTDAAGPARAALFLDRDGCLIAERHYLSDPAQVALLPGAAAALRRAREAGFLLIGVSNQSGIGRGAFNQQQLDAVMRRLTALLATEDAPLDAFYYCPHAPRDNCACRKPATGLLDEAAERFRWEAAKSWVIGDKLSDVDLALAAGMAAVLVRTGYGAAQESALQERGPSAGRVLVTDDLAAAVDLIVAEASL